ncbi:MAG: threonine/serine dehydratase [Firmicutes bacterium]|jgi:threonine dehydratase|nr:threonine/serine dehydratase [Bacillota bacterium]
MPELWEPTIADVMRARTVVSRFLRPTPLIRPPALEAALGCEVFLKCENLQPVGVFKVRGGLNLLSRLTPEEKRTGVITASTGNHGQSIAYAAKVFGVRAIIGAPEKANPYKVESIRRLGAEVVLHGRDFDEARLRVEELARQEGYRYIHSMNEPLLIAGVATAYLEILEEEPDIDYLFVPIGGGSGACGACIVAKSLNPRIRVIGVQAEKAPAFYLSWKNGRLVETESADTFAEGLATRVAFELPFYILRKYLDDLVLVSEEEMRQAIVLLLESAHQLAEGAGAAATAAARKMSKGLKGKRVALMLSGGNITLDQLRRVLQD